jgi:nicotinate-nucleotide pyrophosphorylase
MARFLIEVPHEAEEVACTRAVQILLGTGSHFLTHADWGCSDGVHRAWIVVEVDTREEARNMLPPAFRTQSSIVKLNKFTMEEIDEILKNHQQKK